MKKNIYRPHNTGVIDAARKATSYAEANDAWLRARSYRRVSTGTLSKIGAIIARRFPFEFAAANRI